MFPPKRPGQRPSNASSPSGATATRPIIGRSGTVTDLMRLPGRSTVPVIRCAVEPPDVAARAGTRSFRNAVPESGTRAPKRPPWVETAMSRFGRTFRTSTTSVSPGLRPLDGDGPTSPGHFPPAFSYHSPQSDSLSSTSPGFTVRTGGRTANVGMAHRGREPVRLPRRSARADEQGEDRQADLKLMRSTSGRQPLPGAARLRPPSACGIASRRARGSLSIFSTVTICRCGRPLARLSIECGNRIPPTSR